MNAIIKMHGKEFASLAELRRYRHNINGSRYRFLKDGQTGTVQWEETYIWGRFTSTTGAQFTVADSEVELLPAKAGR